MKIESILNFVTVDFTTERIVGKNLIENFLQFYKILKKSIFEFLEFLEFFTVFQSTKNSDFIDSLSL